jgi:5-methylcytosine-specific restriction endonuclease McrA
MTLPRSHPHSLEIDHVVPVAHGGGEASYNLAPAHRRCNRQKGKGDRKPRTFGDRSAEW